MKNKLLVELGQLYIDFEGTVLRSLDSSTGIEDWFREYISSHRYAELNADGRKAAFDTYLSLTYFLRTATEIRSSFDNIV